MPDDTQLATVQPIKNPFNAQVPAVASRDLISVEQQRAVAEVQARMIVARANPRDPIRAMDLILQDCTRQTLAESALYQYARGGTSISGPSIRLAETLARRWGNIASGIKEVSRRDGFSECIAYAWDLESGYYDERQFQIRHWRNTKKGGYQIDDERDIYELVANMGQRRKRAVLLSVIPGDVVEAATQQCEETLKTVAHVSPDSIKQMVAAFEGLGVSKAQMEAQCQCRVDAIRPAQVIRLRKIYTSIKDGMSDPEDWFSPAAAPEPRPRREDFEPPKPAASEESPTAAHAFTDELGEIHEFSDPHLAASAFIDELSRAALARGKDGLAAAWENGDALRSELAEDLLAQISRAYAREVETLSAPDDPAQTPTAQQTPQPPRAAGDSIPEKRPRGRPPGSRNKPAHENTPEPETAADAAPETHVDVATAAAALENEVTKENWERFRAARDEAINDTPPNEDAAATLPAEMADPDPTVLVPFDPAGNIQEWFARARTRLRDMQEDRVSPDQFEAYRKTNFGALLKLKLELRSWWMQLDELIASGERGVRS